MQICTFLVCVCRGKEGRYRAGGIVRRPPDNTQVAYLGGLVSDAVPQSTTSYSVHTHIHTDTQTEFLSGELQYHGRAQVSVRVHSFRIV